MGIYFDFKEEHYEVLAGPIAKCLSSIENDPERASAAGAFAMLMVLCLQYCVMFKVDDPRFDARIFLLHCGLRGRQLERVYLNFLHEMELLDQG